VAAAVERLAMRALFYDHSFVQDQDAVRVPHRGQAVGDDESSPVLQHGRQVPLDLALAREANRAGGPVHDVGRWVTVVSRLLKDAPLWSVPDPPRRGGVKKRGRPPTYGKAALSLAKRAGHRRGWQTESFWLYGKQVVKTFKTFLATYRPAGGLIRVVLVQEPEGWVAYFCTDPQATVAQVLEAVADRAAIEQDFHDLHDLKEVHGLGQQQVRHYWANMAVYHLNLWLHTLIELWAWGQAQRHLSDRRDSPWDTAERRPSHADRRNALRRACLRKEIRRAGRHRPLTRKFRTIVNALIKLAT
jgi:hypothetical protein